MERTYPNHPLLGVSAAIWRDNKVLLVERAKEPLKGYWSLPGGLVHAGERLDAAIAREVIEETGLSVDLAGIVDFAEIILPDDSGKIAHHYVIAVFAGYWHAGEAVAGDDASDVCWIAPHRLAALTPLTAGTERIIGKTADFLAKNNSGG
ncbi:MAG: NUDIX hydrolase [Fimbriimonadaceae bacterium]|nr:NUDIX hydrolase [Alphaproteobacteria bacterium]